MIIEEVRTEKQMLMEQWLEALRSGDFEQGTGALREDDRHSEKPKYCCLGVADEVCFGTTWEQKFVDHCYQDDMGSAGSLPDERREMLGLDEDATDEDLDRYCTIMCTHSHCHSACPNREQLLINMNDSGISFDQIAAFIEERGWA